MEAHILIVDDEGFITEVLQRALDKEGYSTQAVEDSRSALEVLADSHFDLILCDLELPGLNGIELYKMLVDNQPTLKQRFIFMTGEMMDPVVQDFLSVHKLPILMKPFDLFDLFKLVATTLLAP
jgi:CheY-like chemotaxis protein